MPLVIRDINRYREQIIEHARNRPNRRQNITDWALEQFRSHYGDRSISKWDIFHYVYAVLHHPQYRQRYAANLKRELPRIPFVGVNGINISDNVILSEGAAHQPGAPQQARLWLAGVAIRARVEKPAPS